ncbi:hypothetical protein [Nocardiopsis sp. MG754419]|uniref:hypothetical protein n=1 Tax=Nocardiopsis sp. MG754419 TaxID=2259865 RepID=UPI001BABC81C|nr:hypothetical protein [Nocardiopsis sp. MG754419]MBR8741367.1 hypothetical protein [Nocardiopsis sp. MG754419]
MTKKNQNPTGLAAAWRPFLPSVGLGIDMSGDAFQRTFGGDRVHTLGGLAASSLGLLLAGVTRSEGTSVSTSGVPGVLSDESGLALDRGKSIGGEHALNETPRRYGALGECPRRIPA